MLKDAAKAEDPKEIWKELKERFEPVSGNSKGEASNEWCHMKMKLGKSNEYLDNYNTAQRKLAACSFTFGEEVLSSSHFSALYRKNSSRVIASIAVQSAESAH